MDKKLVSIVCFLLVSGFLLGLGYGCFFKNTFSIPCPSCGITKAWLALLRGNPGEAISFHPMFWFSPLAFFYCCLKKPIISKKADLFGLALLGAIYLALYIIKL